MNNILKLFRYLRGGCVNEGTGVSSVNKNESVTENNRAVVNLAIYITVCLAAGIPQNYVYAASRNETLVEDYIKTMKEIQNYESELARLTENKEGAQMKDNYLVSVESRKDSAKKRLIELLQTKDKKLEDIRKRKGEEEYLKRKGAIEDDEEELKVEIKQLQEEADNILASLKQRKAASEKSIKERINSAQKRLQNIADDYSRFNAEVRDIRDAVSALDKVQKDGTDEPDIASGGENKEGPQYFTVFDIPLNATPQEVANVLEKNNIELSGIFYDDDKNKIIEDFEQALIEDYHNWHSEDKLKEVIGIFDSKKFNFFGFRYQNKQCYLYPSSFDYFHKDSNNHIPLFEVYHDMYNSQFHLLCSNVPNEMAINGISKINILFGSIDGNIPRSFLIGFSINPTTDIIALLTSKYGEPKVYCMSLPWQTDRLKVELHKVMINLLKKKYPSTVSREFTNLPSVGERKPTILYAEIYPKIYKSIIVNPDPRVSWFAGIPWFDCFNVFSTYDGTSCLFEWDLNDIKILLPADLIPNKAVINVGERIEEYPTDVLFRPKALIYINPSLATNLYNMYQAYYKKVLELMQSIHEEGMGKF